MTTRSAILAALIALPTLMFAIVGGYAIWQNGSLGWVWWLMTGCALVAWGLALAWRPTSDWSTTSAPVAGIITLDVS